MSTQMQLQNSIPQDNIAVEMSPTNDTDHRSIDITSNISIVYKKQTLVKKALNADIYHLFAVMYARNKEFPILLAILSACALIIQCLGLSGMIWGYQLEETYSESIVYNIQYLKLLNNTLAIDSDWTGNNTAPSLVSVRELTTFVAKDPNFSIFDGNELQTSYDTLHTAKDFMGFMAVFILLIYLTQSITSYSFLWYLPDYIDKFRFNKSIKYSIKFISFINLIMIYLAWMICIWTLFNVGGLLDIIDMVMTPLGIVFILEVDDWMVNIYLMLEFEEDDGDDDYDGGEELWIVETNRMHIRRFKWMLFVILLCMILPPIVNRIIFAYVQFDEELTMNEDYIMWDDDMLGGGIAVVTYAIIGGIGLIAIFAGSMVTCCNKPKNN